MADILGQLFGMQQPQDQGGLVQSILSQRFQPQPEDAASAMGQTLLNGKLTNASDVMGQRMAVPMQTANMLGALQEQSAKTQGLNLQNQMTEYQMPFLQQMMQDAYGNGQPQIPQQNNNLPPVGFNDTQQPAQESGVIPYEQDPRVRKSVALGMMGNKAGSDAMMESYTNDPNVIAKKSEATKTGENTAGNTLLEHKADELTKRLEMNLNAMLELNPNVPSSGFIPASAKVYMSQGMGANEMGDKGVAAGAAQQWDQINNQQILSEIQQFIASGGANTRTNQTLERIVRAASGIDRNALPASRESQIRNALTEIQNKNISAGNLVGKNQPYQPIPVNTPNGANSPSNGGLKDMSDEDLMKALQ